VESRAFVHANRAPFVIATANITMQFGAKPLFENVSVKFNNGNRYGLIGANGCGKSTFMKILGGDLEPSSVQVMLDGSTRLGKLRQDQFAFENERVIDTVIMGNVELWSVAAERERIYLLAEMSEEDGMAVADLEVRFAELDGYTAEPRASELLLGLGTPIEQHTGPISSRRLVIIPVVPFIQVQMGADPIRNRDVTALSCHVRAGPAIKKPVQTGVGHIQLSTVQMTG